MRMFIAGELSDSSSGQTTEIRNPATGDLVDTIPKATVEDMRRAIDAAQNAFAEWAALPAVERAALMFKAAQTLREHVPEIAELLTREQGKTLLESRIETQRLADNLDFFAGLHGALRGQHVEIAKPKAYGMVIRRPLGVVGAIVPWNFPLTLMANKICPALVVGNTVVVKPASTAPLAIARCVELINAVGFPAGVLNVVTGPGAVVGEELIANPLVRKIGFTGETETGKHVMAQASKELKHVTLELGGSDPMIVCDDANLDEAVKAAGVGRFFNCGQACLAIKRLYLFEEIADQFIAGLKQNAEQRWRVGNGLDKDTRMGPLHTAGQREEVEKMVQEVLDRGAHVVSGAKRPEGEQFERGNFYLPTLLTNVPEDAVIATEECFGPALPIFRVEGLDEAIEKANNSKYGLGSSIWTTDIKTAHIAAERLEAGYTWVNSLQIAVDELPFGGTKQSGFGKEHGTEVLDYYTEQKSVMVGAV
ncbi:MAG TPA: aldehyde dehydrogenase family protein [Chloroflexota bacterium]|nr:aldehyde dehydrogenase family protein [Chloroflexota bacterium]